MVVAIMTSSSNNNANHLSLIEIDSTVGNPLIARGAFGHVDIALLAHWASDSSQPSPSTSKNRVPSHTIPQQPSSIIQSISLAAIKTIPNATSTIPSSSSKSASLSREAFAELNALRLLNGHENVTPLLGFYVGRDALSDSKASSVGFGGWEWAADSQYSTKHELSTSLCLVFPYHTLDLADALNYRRLQSFDESGSSTPHHYSFYLPPIVIQSIMHDVLSALKHLHEHNILHRDVKPGNLYITEKGTIQLGDFGLAKAVVVPMQVSSDNIEETNIPSNDEKDTTTYQNKPNISKGLCTLQYRPPELLLGGNGIINPGGNDECGVNGALDIWSVGCIFAELLTFSGPLFPGQSVLDQLGRIFHVLGTPTNESWPGVSMLPDWNKVCFESTSGSGLKEKIVGKDLWNNVGKLIEKMLSLDPLGRPSANECLNHTWVQVVHATSDESCQVQAHLSVVKELIPSSLQIASPVYFSPSTKSTGSEDGRDPFAYAKKYASKLASSRRSFPQSAYNHSKDSSNNTDMNLDSERWKCNRAQTRV